jgi:hypothetical protein
VCWPSSQAEIGTFVSKASYVLETVNEAFPSLALAKAILLDHVVGVQLNLKRFPDHQSIYLDLVERMVVFWN